MASPFWGTQSQKGVCGARIWLPQPAGELGPRAHAQLGVDAGQVTRHRALGQEERRSDLGVRPSRSQRERRHDARRVSGPRRAFARRSAPARRAPAPPSRRAPSSSKPAQRRLDRVAGRPLLPRPPSSDAEREQRARPAEGSPTASCTRPLRRARSPASMSPRAAATSPRHRIASASAQRGRAGARPPPTRRGERRRRRRGRARAAPRPAPLATRTCSAPLRRRDP